MAETDVVVGLIERVLVSIGGVETRLAGVETRLVGLEAGQAKLEAGQAKLEAGQAKLEAGQAKLEAGLARVDVEQGAMRRDIGLQIERVLNKQAEFSDDLSVVMARLTRVDHTTRAAVDEVRAMHSQHTRLAARVGAIEKKDDTPD
jgi:hypothetical protein